MHDFKAVNEVRVHVVFDYFNDGALELEGIFNIYQCQVHILNVPVYLQYNVCREQSIINGREKSMLLDIAIYNHISPQ